jgi:hypothetical protein
VFFVKRDCPSTLNLRHSVKPLGSMGTFLGRKPYLWSYYNGQESTFHPVALCPLYPLFKIQMVCLISANGWKGKYFENENRKYIYYLCAICAILLLPKIITGPLWFRLQSWEAVLNIGLFVDYQQKGFRGSPQCLQENVSIVPQNVSRVPQNRTRYFTFIFLPINLSLKVVQSF